MGYKAKYTASGGVEYYEKLQDWLAKSKKERLEQKQKEKEKAAEKRKKEAAKKRKEAAAKKKKAELAKKRRENKIRKDMEKINKKLQRWDLRGLTSNDLVEARDAIDVFNEAAGFSSGDFHVDMAFSDELMDEAEQLIQSLQDDLNIDSKYYENLFNKMQTDEPTDDKRLINLRELKDRFDLESTQDVINFIDEMERYKSSALEKEILSSEQDYELYSYGSSLDLTFDDVATEIYRQYSKTGKKFYDLYTLVFDALTELANERKK